MHKKSKREESPLYSDPSGGPQRVTGPATSLGSPQFLREWKSLSSSIQGSEQPCQGLQKARRDTKAEPRSPSIFIGHSCFSASGF